MCIDLLSAVWQECQHPNWDGYNALPVEEATFNHALTLIQSLPIDVASPDIGAEPDGCLTLDWHRDPNWAFSISIDQHGMLYYAALLGADDPRGSELFTGTIPEHLLTLIRLVKV